MTRMHQLAKGANAPVPSAEVRVCLSWASGPDVDVSALLCHGTGKVGSGADFVFFNQPDHPSGAVQHLPSEAAAGHSRDALEVTLLRVPAEVETIVIAASADRAFGQVADLALTVDDAGTGQALLAFPFAAGTETAIVAAELYRRAGSWKLRAVGQGYDDGLAGLARDYGITVDDPGPGTAAAPTPAPTTAPAPVPAPTGGVDWLNPPVPAGYEI